MTRPLLIHGASVLADSGEFSDPLDVLVRDGLIVGCGANLAADDAAVIDGTGLWLMPGVFDCHAHPAMWSRDQLELLRTPITEWAVTAAAALERTLRGGVTFLRDAGGVDAGLRRATDKGLIDGPTLQIAITLLTQTGGQMDGFLAGAGIEMPMGYVLPDYPGRPPYRADGADEMRRAVRQLLRGGADWIKIVAGSGAHVEGQDWNSGEYTLEEVAVAVEEAARVGKRVMADSKTPTSIRMCVDAGVASIEHGVFLDEATAQAMAAADVWLVPTNYVYRDLLEQAETGMLEPQVAAAVRDMTSRSRDLIPIALEHGVKIALGSDAYGNHMHGNNLRELTYLSDAGMPMRDVLLTATIRGAELCGVADRYGRIAPGYVFDALLLRADPSDARVFSAPDTVGAVFKNGELRYHTADQVRGVLA